MEDEIMDTEYCPVTDTYYPTSKYESRLAKSKQNNPARLRIIEKYKLKPLEQTLLAKV